MQCACGQKPRLNHVNVTVTIKKAHEQGWLFYFKGKTLKAMCPVCAFVNNMLDSKCLAILSNLPVWKQIKEIVLDDCTYEELFPYVEEFDSFWRDIAEHNLEDMLEYCDYDRIKAWLEKESKYRNEGTR